MIPDVISIPDIVALLGVIFIGVKIFFPALIPTRAEKAGIVDKRADTLGKYQDMLDEEIVKRKELQDEVDGLKNELSETRREVREYKAGVCRLIKQIESHGQTPVWKPETKKASA